MNDYIDERLDDDGGEVLDVNDCIEILIVEISCIFVACLLWNVATYVEFTI